MPLYDLMLLLDPGAPSDRQETILRDVQGLLEKSGKVVGTYDWGSRRMTFEINHRPDAAYHLFQFETEGGPAPLDQVDHSLKIMDGVLRHRIIRLKDGSPPPPVPRDERRGGWGDVDGSPSDVPAAPAATPQPEGEAVVAEPAEEAAAAPADVPAEAPAEAATATTEDPAAPAEAPAPEAEPAGDDEAPSGPAAA